MENLKTLIETLTPMNRCLLGSGYDSALEYLKHLINLEVIEIPSGTQYGTWTVPDEWIVRDAWVKFKGEKIIDYQKEPLGLIVGSLPFNGKVTLDELKKHLRYDNDNPDVTPYVMNFYEKDWGFCVPKNQIKAKLVKDDCDGCEPVLKAFDPEAGKVAIQGDKPAETVDRLEQGEYEVFIDTEWKPGKIKLGVHTIKGNSDREILLFAHLDHPFQANDNLSAVACLVDLAIKLKCEHTIKIIFCPETIGSIAYAHTQDISKVDFVIAVETCGNVGPILLQKSWNPLDKINRVAHCALQIMGKTYKKGQFRAALGSDETVFNDPNIGIPGLLISRFPYKEYHTAWDTPDKINYEMIKETGDLIMKIIDIWEKDFVPVRKFKGPLMRSRFGLQSFSKHVNLNYDYLFYNMDGKRSLAELCAEFEMNFDVLHDTLKKIAEDGQISGIDTGKEPVESPYKQEHA